MPHSRERCSRKLYTVWHTMWWLFTSYLAHRIISGLNLRAISNIFSSITLIPYSWNYGERITKHFLCWNMCYFETILQPVLMEIVRIDRMCAFWDRGICDHGEDSSRYIRWQYRRVDGPGRSACQWGRQDPHTCSTRRVRRRSDRESRDDPCASTCDMCGINRTVCESSPTTTYSFCIFVLFTCIVFLIYRYYQY